VQKPHYHNGQRQADGQGRDHADLTPEFIDVFDATHVFAIDLDAAADLGAGVEIMVRLRQRNNEVLPDCAGQ